MVEGDLTRSGIREPDAAPDAVKTRFAAIPRRWIVASILVVVALGLLGGSMLTQGWGFGRTARPGMQVKAGDPNTLASSGAQLERVVDPPDKTLAVVGAPGDGELLVFDVDFQLYGIGPDGAVVVRLDSVAPGKGATDSSAKLAEGFAGRNALVYPDQDARRMLTRGGSFSGIVQVEHGKQGGILVVREVSSEPR